jgi:DNA-binding transcriptional regulator YdaS (Cro superfamily)
MDETLSPAKLALHRAAKVLGGQAAIASLLGYSDRRNVAPWFSTARAFPAEHCPTVEAATRERGQPVTCEELRPDVRWDVLRLQSAEPATAGEA